MFLISKEIYNTKYGPELNIHRRKFLATWCINSEKNDKNDFPYRFKWIIFRYKKMYILKTFCDKRHGKWLNSFAYLSDCTMVDRAPDSMVATTYT